MTPELQAAESAKYISPQYCFVPHEDGTFTVFNSYGAARTPIARMSPAELADFIRADFDKARRLHEGRRERDLAAQRESAGRQRSLAALNIDIQL